MKGASSGLRGKTCVITGATSGIGRASAVALSYQGADLILVGRNESNGRNLASRLSAHRDAGRVEFLRADISDQSQVRALASKIADRQEHVDVLINNAGAKFDTFQRSADGIELTFATNYLGHFLLTLLLLERLLQAKEARVISVGSSAHAGAGAPGTWELGPENYNRKLAYGKSKLANVVFAYELARRLAKSKIVSNAVDPGGVATNLGRNNGLLSWFRHLTYYALKRELCTPAKGAEGIIHLASASSVTGVSGKYFYQNREIESSPSSYDPEAAAQLWSLSLKKTCLDAKLGAGWLNVESIKQSLGCA